MKRVLMSVSILFATTVVVNAQTNFSGSWAEPQLEMISGKQYSNAVPKSIKVTQTKDSIKLEKVSANGEADITTVETVALNGKPITRVGKTSKRSIQMSATWSSDKKTLTIITIYSYPEKPTEAEYKNTEVWELNDGALVITKTSDATVTDDWTIKATYSK